MRILDEATLVAYVDGELDPATAREVEEAVAKDAQAQALLDDLIASSSLVRSAFAGQLSEPVPQRLVDAVRNEPDADAQSVGGPAPWWGRRISALAASILLLAAGFGGGFLVFGERGAVSWDSSGQAMAVRIIEGRKLFNGSLNLSGYPRESIPDLPFRFHRPI